MFKWMKWIQLAYLIFEMENDHFSILVIIFGQYFSGHFVRIFGPNWTNH